MADEMTLQQIGERLDAIQGDIRDIKKDVGTLKTDVRTLKTDVRTLKTDVRTLKTDAALKTDLSSLRDEMRIQFEETHRLLKFGLESREGLRETMDARFKEADGKHDQQIELLKTVLTHARRRVDRIERRRRRR